MTSIDSGNIFVNMKSGKDEEFDELIDQLEESTQKLNAKIEKSKTRQRKEKQVLEARLSELKFKREENGSKPKVAAPKEYAQVTGTNIPLYVKAIGSEKLQKWHQKNSNIGKIEELLKSGGEKEAIGILEKMNRKMERISLTLLEFAVEKEYNTFLEKVFSFERRRSFATCCVIVLPP